MYYDFFCTLCGAPLTSDNVLDLPGPDPETVSWGFTSEVLSIEDVWWLNGPLSMLGKKEHNNNTPSSILPRAEIFDCSDCDGSNFFEVSGADGAKHWCYAFERRAEEGFQTYNFVLHDECLSILRSTLATYNLRHSKPSLDDFYNALCIVMDAEDPNWQGLPLENEHFGAAQFWEYGWVADHGWEFLLADPNDIPDATQYIISKLNPILPADRRSRMTESASVSDQRSPSGLTEGVSALQNLPPEILTQIGTNLPIEDVFPLRLMCKAFARGIPLTQNFWQQRLAAGELFGLHFLNRRDLEHVEKGRDWRRLVKDLATYENFSGEETQRPKNQWGVMHDAPLGLRNHMRIWKIITELLQGIDKEQ